MKNSTAKKNIWINYNELKMLFKNIEKEIFFFRSAEIMKQRKSKLKKDAFPMTSTIVKNCNSLDGFVSFCLCVFFSSFCLVISPINGEIDRDQNDADILFAVNKSIFFWIPKTLIIQHWFYKLQLHCKWFQNGIFDNKNRKYHGFIVFRLTNIYWTM